LDIEVFIPVKPAPFCNSIAADTVHLTFLGQDLNFACIPQKIRNFRSMAFGCALSVLIALAGHLFSS
jgi:hypothetical protein